jgi:hypothetical protein
VAKKCFESKSESIRKVRRPTVRCLEDAENDLWELKLKGWRQEANTAEARASAVKEALRGVSN